MKSSPSTELFNLVAESVAYENNVVLKNITLQIDRGEKVALVGPSGAGKTTLLRRLYNSVADQSAFVDQHYALIQQLSAFHNIYTGRLDQYSTFHNLLNLLKPQKKELQEITPILGELRMEEKIFEKVGAMSGGQQQRVAVARAIYRGEDILLADEPISSVDPLQADTVMDIIIQNTETVVVSLHAVEFALKFAQRIVGLSDGEIEFDLPTEEVTQTMLTELYRNGKPA